MDIEPFSLQPQDIMSGFARQFGCSRISPYPVISAVFDSMILELFSKLNNSVIFCVWIALQ